jgi:hypothetical protein
MTDKHTPGPWEITGISQDTGSISVGQRDLRIVIADVTNAASFGDMIAGAMSRGGGSLRQLDASTQFANAHLIAASPDLLTVARYCLAMVEDGAVPPDWDWVRGVIARATGEAR